MKKNILILFFSIFINFVYAQSPALIINEISQGEGTKEYIELLVVGDCTTNPTIDLRGWLIDDNSGQYGTGGSSSGTARLSKSTKWSAIPIGSLIVIYNDNNGAFDVSSPFFINDDPEDLIVKDSVYVIPAKSTLLEHSKTVPNTVVKNDYSITDTDYIPGGHSGIVSVFSSSSSTDVYQLRKPTNTSYNSTPDFVINWTGVGTGNFTATDMQDPNKVIYLSDKLSDISNLSSGIWLRGDNDVVGTETPGVGNTPANIAWIKNMRGATRPNNLVSVTTTSNKKSFCINDAQPNVTINVGSGAVPHQGINYQYTLRNRVTGLPVSTSAALPQNPQSSNNPISFLVKPTVTTVYEVLATNKSTGCNAVLLDTVTVTVYPTPTLNLSPTGTICEGAIDTLKANQSLVSFLWKPSNKLITPADSTAKKPLINPLTNTTYTLNATDVNGCKNTGTIVYTVGPKPSISSTLACTPVNLLNIVTDSKNTNPVFGLYTNAALTTKVPDSSNVIVGGNYFVLATNSSNCKDTISITINQTPQLNVIEQSGVICEPTSVNLTNSVSDPTGAPGEINFWTDLFNTHTLDSTNITTSGWYYFTKLTPSGCTATDSLQLTFTPKSVASFTITDYCEGTPTPNQAQNILNAGTFTASNGLSINSTTAQANPGFLPGNYVITLTTPGSCPDVTTRNLVINPKPKPTVVMDCSNNNFQGLIASGNTSSTFEWYIEGFVPSLEQGNTFNKNDFSNILPPSSGGSLTNVVFYAQETDTITGCSDTTRMPYTSIIYPEVLASDTAICRGQSLNFNSLVATNVSPNQGTGANQITYHYSYTTNPLRSLYPPGYVFSESKTTNVYALLSQNGCVSIDTLTIKVNPLPVVNFSVNPTEPTRIFNTVQFTNLSTNSDTINWDVSGANLSFQNSASNPIIVFPDSGLFNAKLVIKSAAGCSDSITKLIHVKEDFNIFIPKAFSPNKDGKNELLQPIVNADVTDFIFEVYNSWGQLIYESKDVQNAFWDGTFNGANSPIGTYAFNLSYTYKNKKQNQKGTFYLIR